MGRDYVAVFGAAAVVSLVLAFLLIITAVLLPLVYNGGEPTDGLGIAARSLLPVAAMLLIILSGLLWIAGGLAIYYEIATSKNDGNWKALWFIAIFVFGIIGIAAYFAIGRKERKS